MKSNRVNEKTVEYKSEYYIYKILFIFGISFSVYVYMKFEYHCKENNIIKRQRNKGLYIISYRLSNLLFSIIYSLFVSTIIIISGNIFKLNMFKYTSLSYLVTLFFITILTSISIISFFYSLFSKIVSWFLFFYISDWNQFRYYLNELQQIFCEIYDISPYYSYSLGEELCKYTGNFVSMIKNEIIMIIIIQSLILFIDFNLYDKYKNFILFWRVMYNDEDEDPPIRKNERNAVKDKSKENSNIIVYKVSKCLNMTNIYHRISCSFEKNKCNVIYGKNKSGKSTLLYLISGLMSYKNGIIYINGLDLNENLSDIKKEISFCYEDEILYEYLTVEEQLKLYI